MKTKNGKAQYRITVRALGYDDSEIIVDAKNLREARKSERAALVAWTEKNDVDYSARGLASVNISQV